MMNDQVARIREEFIEKVGVIVQGEAFPRISGRVFATLIYDGEPVLFGELAEKLNVSRCSISSSVRLLENFRVIKRVAKPDDRQDYFQIADNAFAALVKTSAMPASKAAKEIATRHCQRKIFIA